MLQKVLYISLGTTSLALGLVGIVLPGLPTTPFVLLAAWFYLRSSNRLYNGLVAHPMLGKYITNYSKGVSRKMKRRIILLMWIMVLTSSLIFIKAIPVKAVVLLAGVVGTLVVWHLKEPEKNEKS